MNNEGRRSVLAKPDLGQRTNGLNAFPAWLDILIIGAESIKEDGNSVTLVEGHEDHFRAGIAWEKAADRSIFGGDVICHDLDLRQHPVS